MIFPAIRILCVLLCVEYAQGWTNEEFEMFDLVEELNSANFYEFLGVSNDASIREIKTAYRQLSVKLHPDKNPDDPNAHINFRQLVGVYEVLKDDELRKSYHDVLEFGLPNWRQPAFYFRRARKLAMWQVGLLLLIIISTGQYLAAWGSYFERKLSLQEMVETKLRKTQRSKKAQKDGPTVHEVQAELEEQYLQKPSIFNTAPFQLMRFGKYMVVYFPFDVIAEINYRKEQRQQEQERILQEKLYEEEQSKIVIEPKKPRKRKTFQAPEREYDENETAVVDSDSQNQSKSSSKPEEVFVSGGLWTDDDISLLIKLCTKYPGGFPDRWNQISQMMRRPVGEVTHFAKKVLSEMNKKQEENPEEEAPTVKVKVKTKAAKMDDDLLVKVMSWSKDEQKRLELALQMYPKGCAGDRWGKIASHVGKSKEECMQRYKHVAELVKKKKEQLEEKPADVVVEELPVKTEIPSTSSPSEPSSIRSSKIDEEKDALSRQNSSSSTGSEENDWCIVDSQNNGKS